MDGNVDAKMLVEIFIDLSRVTGCCLIENNTIFIPRKLYDDALLALRINPKPMLKRMKNDELILTRGKNMTRGKRINGILIECVALKISAAVRPEYIEI